MCFTMLLLALGILGWLLWRQKMGIPPLAASNAVATEGPPESESEAPAEQVRDAVPREPSSADISNNASHLSDRVVHNMSIHEEGESRPFVSSLESQYRCVRDGEVRAKLKIREADELRREGWQCEDVLYRGPVDTVEIAKLEEAPSSLPRPAEDPPIIPGPSMSGWESHGKRSSFFSAS